ncbi:MAG: hypothetical protein OXP09_14710 [Gammaproteobacteria bacterium]|nr:hypothetical protein [Gammaproteobacteria bacterium]
MKTVRVIAGGTVVLVSVAAAVQPPGASITTQPTRSLEGAAAPIEAHPVDGAVLVLAFSRKSNRQVESWTHRLNAILSRPSQEHQGGLRFYNVIVLAEAPRLVRGMIRRAIRSGVPKVNQGKYRIVERDAAFWRALAAVDDASQAHVLRIDPGGRVCERKVGPVTDQALADILEARCTNEAVR